MLLVTEPTPFGLNDLKLAVEMVRAMKLPLGVVINRADSGDDRNPRVLPQGRVSTFSRKSPTTAALPRLTHAAFWQSEAMPEIRTRFELLLARMLVRRRREVCMSELVGIPTPGRRPVKELVVISGKGGTGKTSMVASFAALSQKVRAG